MCLVGITVWPDLSAEGVSGGGSCKSRTEENHKIGRDL